MSPISQSLREVLWLPHLFWSHQPWQTLPLCLRVPAISLRGLNFITWLWLTSSSMLPVIFSMDPLKRQSLVHIPVLLDACYTHHWSSPLKVTSLLFSTDLNPTHPWKPSSIPMPSLRNSMSLTETFLSSSLLKPLWSSLQLASCDALNGRHLSCLFTVFKETLGFWSGGRGCSWLMSCLPST